jgi:DNA-binding NtrC family response regulator
VANGPSDTGERPVAPGRTERDDDRGAPPSANDSSASVRRFGRVVARSAAMREAVRMLERFAPTEVTLVLLGETGVGKEVVAHAVHANSSRADAPLVIFDCGSVAANLAESELLGHERGSFTGAVTTHAGAFERAHGGTLFLDEIAELPLDLQTRLLRALESRQVRRVGGRVELPVDLRIIAATNRDLRAEVAAGRFREDLIFRLGVAIVEIPPLRSRQDDLPDIVYGLLSELGRGDLQVSDGAFDALKMHPWPGNVRELKNALACAIAFVDPDVRVLERGHLVLLRQASWSEDATGIESLPLGGKELEGIERAAIRQTLIQTQGNKAQAARLLGIALSTLYLKMKKYGL